MKVILHCDNCSAANYTTDFDLGDIRKRLENCMYNVLSERWLCDVAVAARIIMCHVK